MNQNGVAAVQNEELTRLEILQAFKKHFAGDGTANKSPFADDRVVRIQTNVDALDVPEIHQTVRKAIEENLHRVRRGEPSRVVILAGEPGMGKSHLINHFRCRERAAELGYILVCNSNHWKVQEFDRCLLDWILKALLEPVLQEAESISRFDKPLSTKPHLLLQKIEDIAFQALSQILTRPGLVQGFVNRKASGVLRRLWAKLTGSEFGDFQQAVEKRDVRIFKKLDFHHFANYVCDRFLEEPSNVFHRYVLQVVLHYVLPEEREKVLHWLRRVPVDGYSHKVFGVEEKIDCNYKVIDTIKVLISLFTPEVSKNLNPSTMDARGRVFFFAFDQIEGRAELFEDENDWLKFFAQLSELYNALPNVFVLFTMTTDLRDRLYPKMERQFRDRIQRDQKFVLRQLDPSEILAVYSSRIDHWLGNAFPDLRSQLEDSRFRFLPFGSEEIIKNCSSLTLRASLDDLDERFRKYLDEKVTLKDPILEFLAAQNELRREEEQAGPKKYTEKHLETLTQLLNRAGGFFAAHYGLNYNGLEPRATDDAMPALRLSFRDPRSDDQWARAFVTRLPVQFNAKLEGCFKLIRKKATDRNYLWLLRAEKVDKEWEAQKPDQIRARVLEPTCETTLRAMLHLLDKRDRFKLEDWKKGERLLLSEFNLTYLGEMFQEIADTLSTEPEPSPKEPMTDTGDLDPSIIITN